MTIGASSIIGAGSVVAKDVPEYSIVVGNPAKVLRDRARGPLVRVLFLQRQPCIRAMKYAIGLRARHPEIALGFAYQGKTLTGWYGTGDELFDGWWALPRTDAAAALAEVVDGVPADAGAQPQPARLPHRARAGGASTAASR